MEISRRTFLLGMGASLCCSQVSQAAASWKDVIDYHRAADGDSLLILRGGRKLAEDGDRRSHELASGTKSFWGVLTLLLVKERLLGLEDRLDSVIQEWKSDPRGAVTLHQLLTLTSGIAGGSTGRPPTFAQALQTPMRATPGSRFQYGPAPYQIYGEFLRRKLGDPLSLLQKYVLGPADVSYESWKRGLDGQIHLPSGARLTAQQWSRFGLWVNAHRDSLRELRQGTTANPAYGLTWWLNQAVHAGSLTGPMRAIASLGKDPSLPRDLFIAAGAGDQRLYIIPSRDVIVVRQAGRIVARVLGGGSHWSDTAFLKKVMQAL